MAELDIAVQLPDGWVELDNPHGPTTFSPDGGSSVLQLSSPSWAARLRGADVAQQTDLMKELVEGGKLGRPVSIGPVDLPYGKALRAEIESTEHAEVRAWILVPSAADVLLVTWVADHTAYGGAAAEIVGNLRPGLLGVALGIAVDKQRDAKARAELSPHAVLFGAGNISVVQLATLPQDMWTDACRDERARARAGVILQVLAGTSEGKDVAVIYGESPSRHRRLLVNDDGVFELAGDRVDLFAPADPKVAAALAAARR